MQFCGERLFFLYFMACSRVVVSGFAFCVQAESVDFPTIVFDVCRLDYGWLHLLVPVSIAELCNQENGDWIAGIVCCRSSQCQWC